MEHNPANSPIRISDACMMFRKEIQKNERPYTASVLKENNALVDEWYNTVLKKICNRQGQIMAGQVWIEWNYFYDGKTIPTFVKAIEDGHIPTPLASEVQYWKTLFEEKSISELIQLGAPTIGHGWKLILSDMYTKKMMEKWDKVYKECDDPLIWRKKGNDFPKLWSQDSDFVFVGWDAETSKDVAEKVGTILHNPIRVD